MSKTILLNQNWIFSKEGHDEPVTLPHTWNAVDGNDGNGSYLRTTGVYTRTFEQPKQPREGGMNAIGRRATHRAKAVGCLVHIQR